MFRFIKAQCVLDARITIPNHVVNPKLSTVVFFLLVYRKRLSISGVTTIKHKF